MWLEEFFFSSFSSLRICLCHSDQSRDEKKKPISSSKQQNFSCLFNGRFFNANFWCVQSSVFFFFPLPFPSSALLFLHLLFISFSLSVGSATSKNIWVHYTVLVAQRNIVFFTREELRERKVICDSWETTQSSSVPKKKKKPFPLI